MFSGIIKIFKDFQTKYSEKSVKRDFTEFLKIFQYFEIPHDILHIFQNF